MPPRDVSEATFETDVLAESGRRPVIVDFWAPWCGPCRTLGPVLERVVEEQGDAVTLVKVDTDQNPRLAMAYGIQGIPAVKAFKDGRVVDEFTGALPEPAVRQWVSRLAPSPHEGAVAEAERLLEAGELEKARTKLDAVPALDPSWLKADALLARIDLLELAQSSGDRAALEAQVAADPSDVAAAVGLAAHDLASGRGDAGMERLVALVAARGDAADRARDVSLLAFRAASDPAWVRTWQGRLSMAMY